MSHLAHPAKPALILQSVVSLNKMATNFETTSMAIAGKIKLANTVAITMYKVIQGICGFAVN